MKYEIKCVKIKVSLIKFKVTKFLDRDVYLFSILNFATVIWSPNYIFKNEKEYKIKLLNTC